MTCGARDGTLNCICVAWILGWVFRYVFFLGQASRSALMRDTLLAFPQNFSLRMDTQHPERRVFAIRRSGSIWSILPAHELENPTWVLSYRSAGVLRRVLFLQLSLHQAFVERRVTLKGSIPESLRLLKAFDILFSYLMPTYGLTRRFSRTPLTIPIGSKIARVVGFVMRLPFWAFKKEFDLS